MGGTRIWEFLKREGSETLSDIEGWRSYYFNLILFLACILLPIALAATFTTYIKEARWGTLFFQIGIFVFLGILFYIRNTLVRWGLFFFFLYATVITFFISLGPFYARPAWLVLCTVMAALLFGVPAALASVGMNAVILLVLYFFIGPHLSSWSNVYNESSLKWIIFTINTSFVSLVASLPVSMLLQRLGRSFHNEKELRENLLHESDVVKETISTLKKEISQRMRVEESLQKSERRFRSLAENSFDTIMRFDRQYRHLYVNPQVQRETNIDPESFLGKTHRELGFPEDLCMLCEQAIDKVFDSGMVNRVEFMLPTGIWIDWLLAPETDETGRVIAVVTSSRDITERKQREAELRIFKESLDNSTDAIGISDPQGRHYYQNQAFTRLFGEIGENPTETLYIDRKIGHEVFKTVMAGGQWTGEVEMYSRNRDVLHIYLRAYANKDIDGNITALVGIHTDITERKKAEEELIKEKNFSETLVQSSPAFFVAISPEGKTLMMNESLLHALGYTKVSMGMKK